ncbi:MAG TPA: proton-conducting transporter membrane subunit [Candidatus Bathyarchaeia archaeon]|nr:proton-conducting transporter membrane subunit [Candidatus Bathyarchaeia archaeon]
MHELLYPLVVPAVAGIIPLFVPRRGKIVAGIVALAAAVYVLLRSIALFGAGDIPFSLRLFTLAGVLPFDFELRLYPFSSFLLLFIAIFGVLSILYSLGYLWNKDKSSMYYSFILWTLSAAAGAVLADNLLILLIFWEVLTAILFFLVNMGEKDHEKSAAKAFTILGLSDAAMLLGVILVWAKAGTLTISELSIATTTPLGIVAFILLFVGAITKAGAMPFHSWVPAIAVSTPASVMAFLPAALDKLLGIYLLARISIDVFAIQPGTALSMLMMIVGAATIVFAVFMALVQHNLKKLLSFHAVSQVGYMVLGVGSGIPIAIVGGLFHMLNNAIYKSGLFFGAGAIEKRAGTTELEDLGGLAKLMPVTFISMAVCSLSISGIPPFNGFASKWLIYQGMLESRHVVFLIVAIFGSALTLASFVKVLHSVFLGRRPERLDKVKEVDFSMQLPMIFLAILCVLFGIFASYPLEKFIIPIVTGGSAVHVGAGAIATIPTGGFWSPGAATALILVGVILGLLIYGFSSTAPYRIDENPWIGGNVMESEEIRYPGTQFYKTVTEDLGPGIKTLFEDGEKGALDGYNYFGKIGDSFVQVLRMLHNGNLSTYLAWIVIGLGVLSFILIFQL